MGKQLQPRVKHVRVRVRGELNAVYQFTPPSVTQRILVMERWLAELCHFLLKSDKLSGDEVQWFRTLQHDIWQRWREITDRAPTPKVHMLAHAVAFAVKHRRLGFFAESQIESCHAQFNRAYNHTHHNTSHKPAERLRRSLVAIVLPKLSFHA